MTIESKKPSSASLPQEILEAILEAIEPIAVPGEQELKARIMHQVSAMQPRSAGADITTVPGDTIDWQPIAPGVEAKTLYDDGHTRTWLARMESGATLPGHVHHGDEECYVLEGSICSGDLCLKAGDYQLARTGSTHGEIFAPTGCVMLLRSPSLRPARAPAAGR